jgi:hypothetical protein
LRFAELAQPRTAHRKQDDPGHPLPDRNHTDRPDDREGECANRGAGLVRQGAAQHECHTLGAASQSVHVEKHCLAAMIRKMHLSDH